MSDTLAVETSHAARALLESLPPVRSVMSELLRFAQEKLAAIRAARADVLQALAAAEAPLVRQFLQADHARQAATARLAHVMHRPELAGAALRDVAPLLSQLQGAALLGMSAGLRDVAEKLRRTNALVADVARNLQGIVRDVLTEMGRRTQQTFAYGADGRHAFRAGDGCVEAVA